MNVLDKAEIALLSDGFTDIDFHTLQTILNRETLNCKEITVFQVGLFAYTLKHVQKIINIEFQLKLKYSDASCWR